MNRLAFAFAQALAVPLTLAACSSSEAPRQTCAAVELPGHPNIASVFVADEVRTDPIGSRYSITYGVNPFASPCFTVDDCADVAGVYCTKSCPDTSDYPGTCVYPAGQTPIVTQAIARAGTPAVPGSSIHLVLGELAAGPTVEAFACACRAHGSCVGGAAVSADPFDCSVCGDSPETVANEAGACLTDDANGLPAQRVLLAGTLTVSCGPYLTYTNVEGEGAYEYSGSAFPSTQNGYTDIGPHIELDPSVDLPTDADCEVHFAPRLRAYTGEPFVAEDGPIRFHTESLAVTALTPARNAATVSFNVGVRAVATHVTVTDAAGRTVPTAVTVGGGDAHLTFPAGLTPGAPYIVTVTTADIYGRPLPAPARLTFVAP